MQSYGEFVLTSYYTGGRASALYYGLDKQSTDFKSKERDMDKSINASYSWDKNSASGDFSIGTKDGNSSTANESFSELRVSIKTLGGAYGHNVATPPYDVKNTSINLTSWLQSLNDSRTHTMIDIQAVSYTHLRAHEAS